MPPPAEMPPLRTCGTRGERDGPDNLPAEDGGFVRKAPSHELFRRSQRTPTRLTGPPRFIGVPARTPTPGAPTPGVATTTAAAGATTTAAVGRTTQPLGMPTVLQ